MPFLILFLKVFDDRECLVGGLALPAVELCIDVDEIVTGLEMLLLNRFHFGGHDINYLLVLLRQVLVYLSEGSALE